MNRYEHLPRELESTALIHFQECDPFGHLNNARYIDFFINARQEQLSEHYGLEIIKPGQTESWVVNKSQIAFVSPANLMEKVLIRTRLITYTDRTLTVEGLMLNEEGTRLKAISWVEFTYVSLQSGRPVSHPADLMEMFEAVRFDGAAAAVSFDQRVDVVRAQFRRQPQTAEQIAA